ncbi:Toprim domain protein [Kalmanozyma brasiliensis GHG001]|uniref:DNA topoisomerase 2 n=1 Tax=Kalmanozyma brasiliensis (strain GHG001) TaxID=1365824 RepID=V5F2B9_KALBG|nr:Toprim domain protein [Kalmanozyma brasiliensis GHG001]EST09519.1 Toprim domain protein [Kalmanozyma brasiliensis GHG001]
MSESDYMSDTSDFAIPAKKAAAPKTKAPPKPKAAAGAKAGASKASGAAAKPKKQPLAKRNSNGADSDPDVSMIDSEADVSFQPVAPSKSANGKSASETYQKLSQLEHILKRPDTYIGSVEKHTEKLWVFDKTKKQMAYRETTYVPGFYKIFDEILVNAADNKARDPGMTHLKVDINREDNSIMVWNNGHGIPVEMHDKEKVYIPELIFGHLLTSSNYDDNEAKVTGGRNGYGAKLANIYSTEFTVETADAKNQAKYKQTFTKNMHDKGKPKITKHSKADEYTSITFKPDLALFGMESIDDHMEALMLKRVYDMAGTVKGIKVTLNGELLKIKNFKQYVEMYVTAINELGGKADNGEEGGAGGDVPAGAAPKPAIIYESVVDKGRTWEVAFAVSDGEFRQVSFVNNIATIKGGKHVDHVADQVITRLIDHVKKDKKTGKVMPNQVRQQLWVFVNCQIVNPTFDGQTKETLTLKQSAFGSKWTLTDEFAKKVIKSGVVDNIVSFARFKQDQALKKTDGHKRTRITNIPKLEDANNAGGRKARDCTLILTEGDSAKSLAVAGIVEVGRDNYGVFPLRGKLLNVREASHDQIMKNAEIKAIKEILGLQHGKQYLDVNSLRYGSIMIMTDQDHDGSHIKGLIINFLDHFYPSLLKIPGFLVEFVTPIVRCKKGNQDLSFFTIPEYEQWRESHNGGKGWHVKYYKGLGTSDSKDAKKYFRDLPKHRLPFDVTKDGDRELIDLAFNKKKADDRKEWLRQFRPGTYLDHNAHLIPYADFVNKELILFSMADNMRSIPSVVDGLKPGQRKVMYIMLNRKTQGELKVQTLVGTVLGQAAYHHGDAALTMTIVGLAQNFVGSNNVNMLEPRGQFGTRLLGGKDAASGRYIFTALPKISRALFPQSDDALLDYLEDDGTKVEPHWYIPVAPQVLMNGADGIGTGWSTSVPTYNPHEIVANLRRRMAGEDVIPLKPWFRGFTGTVEEFAPGRFKVSGRVNQIDEKTWEITELPIRTWTSNYKESLEERVLSSEKQPATIKDYKEYHTESTVNFIVELTTKGQAEIAEKGPDAFFKLSCQISTTNMVLFDQDGKIKKYSSPEEILEEFYLLRLSYYQKRKEHLVDQLKLMYDKLSNQARFVQMIITRQLVVSNRKRADIVKDLREKDFRPFPKQGKAAIAANPEDDEPVDEEDISADSDFDYLLNMAIYNLTKEKVEKLLKERDGKEEELKILIGRSPQNLWDEDLGKFIELWEEMLEEDERRLKDVVTKVKKGKQTKKASAKTGAAARRVLKKAINSDGEEEDDGMDDIDGDDSEDDFKPSAAAGKKKAAAPARVSPAKKRAAADALDDDDMKLLLGTTSNGAAAKKPRANASVSRSATASRATTPQVVELDDGDDSKLAPLFRAAGTSSKPAAATKKAAAPKKAAASKPVEAPKSFNLSDSEDDTIAAPKAKKAAAAKPAAGKKTATGLGRKKAAAPASDTEDSFMIDSPASAAPARASGRSARGASGKMSYKIDDSEDEDF